MPSKAISTHRVTILRAKRLASLATDSRLRPQTYAEQEPALHASLAAYVSSWEIYVESVVMEFLTVSAVAVQPTTATVLNILADEAKRQVEKFNTPNSDNSRNLILRLTGFDPIMAMQSTNLNLNGLQTRTRLDEILKVRHSFAHGFPMPNYVWLTRYGKSQRLTRKATLMVGKIISDLVREIDIGLKNHAVSVLGVAPWL